MKHPVLSNRIRLIIWRLIWVFLMAGQSLLFYYAYGDFISIGVLDSVLSLLIYSGIALSLWYPFSFFNSGNTRVTTTILNLIISGIISVTLWALTTKYSMQMILPED